MKIRIQLENAGVALVRDKEIACLGDRDIRRRQKRGVLHIPVKAVDNPHNLQILRGMPADLKDAVVTGIADIDQVSAHIKTLRVVHAGLQTQIRGSKDLADRVKVRAVLHIAPVIIIVCIGNILRLSGRRDSEKNPGKEQKRSGFFPKSHTHILFSRYSGTVVTETLSSYLPSAAPRSSADRMPGSVQSGVTHAVCPSDILRPPDSAA